MTANSARQTRQLRFEEDCAEQGRALVDGLWQVASRLEFGPVSAASRPAPLRLDSRLP
jgi:hypothetical protein